MSFNGQYTDIYNKNSSLNGIGDLLVTPINYEYGAGSGVNQVGGQNGFPPPTLLPPTTIAGTSALTSRTTGKWTQANPESRSALGSLHALRRNPRLPGQLRRGGRKWPHRNLLHVQPGLRGARASIFNTVAAASNLNISVREQHVAGHRTENQFRAARRIRLQGPAYAGGARRLRHGLRRAGQPRLRRHAGNQLSLRVHPDRPLARLQSPAARRAGLARYLGEHL